METINPVSGLGSLSYDNHCDNVARWLRMVKIDFSGTLEANDKPQGRGASLRPANTICSR